MWYKYVFAHSSLLLLFLLLLNFPQIALPKDTTLLELAQLSTTTLQNFRRQDLLHLVMGEDFWDNVTVSAMSGLASKFVTDVTPIVLGYITLNCLH